MTTVTMENLSTLFRDKLYRIPDYQRGYAWNIKQLEEFWNDIDLLEEGTKEHYLGVLTTQDVPQDEYSKLTNDKWLIENKHYSPIYIVDGQQRITTCLLLLCAIVEVSENIYQSSALNYTNIDDVKKRFFYEKKGNHDLYSMIFGYLSDDPLHNFLAGHVYKIPNSFSILNEVRTKYTSNLEVAYSYFISKLEDLPFENIEKIFSKLTTRLVFNTYNVSERLDVFVTFETMNNRGKELSVLELLKNRLIYLTTLIPDNTSNADKDVREKINQTWKTLYDYLGKNSENLLDDDTFLSAFLSVYHFPENLLSNQTIRNRRTIFKGFSYHFYDRDYNSYILDEVFTVKNIRNEVINLNDIHNFITELSKNVVIWYELENQVDAEYSIELLQLVLEYNQIYSSRRSIERPLYKIRMFDYFINNPEENKRIKFLETMNYINLIKQIFITSQRYSNASDITIKLEKAIVSFESSEILDFSKIRKDLLGILKDPHNTGEIISLLRESVKNDYKGNKRINFYNSNFPTTYLLSKYETTKLSKNKEVISKEFLAKYLGDNKHYNIEHILPNAKTPSKGWEGVLDNYNADQKHNLKMTLGNLVRISSEKNNCIGNKSFQHKKDKFYSGTYSERIIASQYNVWDQESIKKRGREILTLLLDILGIPKISKTKKDIILGLDELQIT